MQKKIKKKKKGRQVYRGAWSTILSETQIQERLKQLQPPEELSISMTLTSACLAQLKVKFFGLKNIQQKTPQYL